MPIVFRERGLRFFSNERLPREPCHVLVKGGGKAAKIWLEPEVLIVDSYGFNSAELTRILTVIADSP